MSFVNNKYSVDYSALNEKFTEKPTFKYADVADRLVKVAFDIVKFKDSDNIDGLWKIQATDDGEVIVAMYDSDAVDTVKTASARSEEWAAIADSSRKYVNIFYKNDPVSQVKLASFGFEPNDADMLCEILPAKLSQSKSFRDDLLNSLSTNDREELFSKYAELK